MIAAPARRNAANLSAGRAEFAVGTLEHLDLQERRFDRILAMRVGLFQREPDRARGPAERWLAPRGVLLAVFDPPPR